MCGLRTKQRVGVWIMAVVLVMGVLTIPARPVFADEAANLATVKTYLLEKGEELVDSTARLKQAAQAYAELMKAAGDPDALLASQREATATALGDAQAAWKLASPLYEKIEGIVAGVPSLRRFDVILDSGVRGEVAFDVALPNGDILKQPGNFFNLLEATLWGLDPEFIPARPGDLNADGKIEFGEVLPDAGYLSAFSDGLAQYAAELLSESQAWEPTLSDAFTALVVMVPTMKEYFEAWKNSRFIAGDQGEEKAFAVISRLSDIVDIISSLEVIYDGVRPLVKESDPLREGIVANGLVELRTYVEGLLKQEQDGKRFTAEEAELFGTEAQDRADYLAGQIAQIAAQLSVPLAN